MKKYLSNRVLGLLALVSLVQVSMGLTSAQASTQKCRASVASTKAEGEIETQVSQALLNQLAAELGVPRSEIEAQLKNVFDNYAAPVLIDNQIMAKAQYEAGVYTMRMARSVLREGVSRDSSGQKIYDRLSLFDISANEEIAFIDYTIVPTSPTRIFISDIKGDHHSIIRPLTRRLLKEGFKDNRIF